MRFARSLAILVSLFCLAADPAPTPVTIYNPDPNHLWNRLHRALLVRIAPGGEEFGGDTVDPILWSGTRHLLDEPSHHQAIDVLDEFLSAHAERLIADPLKRALLQRDLWAVFDWTAQSPRSRNDPFVVQRRALQSRLAQIIRRLALTKDDIAALPDVYAATIKSHRFAAQFDLQQAQTPFLPADLYDPKGPWIDVGLAGDGKIAPIHVRDFGARSIFEVFFRHPQGRQAGLDYLKTFDEFQPKFLLMRAVRATTHNAGLVMGGQTTLNPDLPQFPAGAQVALVRSAMLVDRDGNLAPTRLIESVQERVFLQIAASKPPQTPTQAVFEFRFSRRDLLASPDLALHALAGDAQEIENVQFQSLGIDPFEASRSGPRRYTSTVLRTCAACHGAAGVDSVNSFTRLFGPEAFSPQLFDAGPDYQAKVTIAEKGRLYDWGLLQGLWRDAPESAP